MNKEGIAIPFCAIGQKLKSTGTLSNEQGDFQTPLVSPHDTIVFYCTGYKRRKIAVADLLRKPSVVLEEQGIILTEVSVFANDERAYTALVQCRDATLKSPDDISKAYFLLESYVGNQPVEVLECFYNSTYNDRAVRDLQFKNGRVALAPFGNRYFINKNTSKAFTSFNLVLEHERLPLCPLQLNLRRLKKEFYVGFGSTADLADSVMMIYFSPKKKDMQAFTGKVWMNKRTHRLQHISMDINGTQRHPFLPLFASHGKIHSVSMHFEKSFSENGKPLHIDFHYNIRYQHWRDPANPSAGDSTFIAKCKGLLYFFDHGDPYIAPYFKYDPNSSDYRMINILSYNEKFWQHQNTPVFSDSVIKAFSYLRKNGSLFNYNSESSAKANFPKEELFENNYPVWSAKKRLSLKYIHNRNLSKEPTRADEKFLGDKYHLKAQIFMDLNQQGDSLEHFTRTILDVQESFYDLEPEEYTNSFLNIYFDICEIERRNLEKELSQGRLTAGQFDSIYKATETRLSEKTSLYLHKVERGKNVKEMEKYNDLVLQQLGINNFELFPPRKKVTASRP